VLSQILSHLSNDELKQARLVSALWNQEASKLIGKRDDIIIKFDFNCASQTDQEINRLNEYCRDMKEQQSRFVKNVEINVFWTETVDLSLDDAPIEIDEHPAQNKFDHDLQFFFNPENKQHNFTKLIMGGDIDSPHLFDIKMNILNLLTDSLLELKLCGKWRPTNQYMNQVIQYPSQGMNKKYKVPSNLEFTKLKKFTFNMDATHGINNWSWFETFVKTLKVFHSVYVFFNH
jgi:hypothetical protein